VLNLSQVKIIIADDEPGVLLLLRSIFSELKGALVVGTAENADNTIKLIKEQSPDLAFLDIELPDMKGTELAEKIKEIKPDLEIVFITAHQEYALEAFKLYALDYILKPIDQERVKTTFERIQQVLKKTGKSKSSSDQKMRISINLGNERVFLRSDEIFYIEKTERYATIHCTYGNFKTRESLHELERNLGKEFFRSHKSFVINMYRIERIINYPNSSYYEIKFKNFKGKALLSRDKIHELMKYSQYDV
jgi:DNA-binding LytR/AlgR family response regulator